MVQESCVETVLPAQPHQTRGHGGREDAKVLRTQVRQFLPLEITPDPFDGVEFGGVPREPLNGEPAVLLGEVGGHGRALVGGEPVPQENHGVAAEAPLQALHEGDERVGIVTPGARVAVAAAPPAIPAEGQHRGHGEAFPVEGVGQDRRLAARRPGAADGGPLGDAAFVVEDEPGTPPPGVFFTAGHRWVIQAWIAASFRSRARVVGRWGVQPHARRSRQTWPGWYRTPVTRSITAATRGSVQHSVRKPLARGPGRSAASTAARAAGGTLGFRPARPAARRPVRPPVAQARCQRITLWRLTPSWRAIAPSVSVPAANSRAAANRRCSRPWKSRREIVWVSMRQGYHTP
jgi:hypothetical protein